MSVPFLNLGVEARILGDELVGAAERVIRAGRYVLGSEVERFELEFAEAVGTAHCVGVGNGLDALTLILRAWGVGPGAEVLVPTNTFVATWLAVTAAGGVPVPVDPDPATLVLDAATVLDAITDRTAAIVPVHLAGLACDVESIRAAVAGRGIRILEDAAQAHGATRDGRSVGGLGDAAAFSFYPSKTLGALGDAGAVTTDDAAVADTVRKLRNYGSSEKYHHEMPGTNSRLDEIQAAFLSVKLPHLASWTRRRSELADAYLEQLHGVPLLKLPSTAPPGSLHAWYTFNVHHPRRDDFRRKLAERGIGTQLYYPVPPHLTPAYAALGYRKGDFPVAERSSETTLALPLSPHLSRSAHEAVVEATWEVASELG